jgi:hypothetical protein
VFQLIVNGADVDVPTKLPSTYKATFETPTLSLAFTETETDRLTVAPALGLRIEIDGAMLSDAG